MKGLAEGGHLGVREGVAVSSTASGALSLLRSGPGTGFDGATRVRAW